MKNWTVAILALIVTASATVAEAQRRRFAVRGRWYRGSAVGWGLRYYPYAYGYGGGTAYGNYAQGHCGRRPRSRPSC